MFDRISCDARWQLQEAIWVTYYDTLMNMQTMDDRRQLIDQVVANIPGAGPVSSFEALMLIEDEIANRQRL